MSRPADMLEDGPNELALSIAWHAGLTREVVTTDGDHLDVVFSGHWTHGYGPDFHNAMLTTSSGHLVTGDVELHFRAADWERHGHHTDPAYNDVVLHIVTSADGFETRRANGGLVPIAILGIDPAQLQAVHDRQPSLWSRFGGDVCAPNLAARSPEIVRTILQRLGDQRLEERVASIESAFSVSPPADVLLLAIFESFGYSRNRDQMRALASRVPWASLLTSHDDTVRTEGRLRLLSLLLGVGGWLPLSPPHAALAMLSPDGHEQVEQYWREKAILWHESTLPPSMWDTSRVRPSNHPVARLATLATLLNRSGSELIPVLNAAIREGQSIPATLQSMAASHESPPIGVDRATSITASVIVPFAVALARATDDHDLEDAALSSWSALRSSALAQPARRARSQIAGNRPITGVQERGNQGLLVLDKRFCTPRRCYECPIAREVVATELQAAQAESSENT